jgi:hypothetical protein
MYPHIFVFSMRSIGSEEHDIVGREGTASTDGRFVDSEFVGGESTRAKNGDTGQFFDGGDTGDNNLVLDKLLGINGERVTDKMVAMAMA